MYKKLSWLLIFVFILTACGGGDDDKGDDKKDDGGGSPAGGAVALVDEWCIARVTGGLGVPPAVFKPLGWLSKAATENSWIKLYSSQAVMDSNDGNLLGEAAPDGIYILIGPQLNLSDHLPEELFTFTVSGELEPYLAVGDYAVGDPVEVAIGGKPALRADAVIEDQDVAVFALMWEVGDEGEYMRMLAAARGDQPNFEAIAYAVAETAFWAEEDVPLPVLPPGLDVPTLDGPVELTLGDPQTVDHSGNPNGALTYSLPAGWIVDESYSDDPTALDYMTLALFSNADAQRRFASRCTYYGDMAALLIRVTDRNTIVGAHEDETPDQARGRSA
ncbi:MAG: hypothetical protein JXQ72_01660, partial [Anaerolineae bacterium]|nr:hypothetical protein [Anaerolineae bacterium]